MSSNQQVKVDKHVRGISTIKWLLFGFELVLLFFLYSSMFLVPGGASRETNLLSAVLAVLSVVAGLFCGKLFVQASGGDHTSFRAIASTLPVITCGILVGITVLVGCIGAFVH